MHKHLTKPRVKVETYDSGSGGDKLTLSLLNLTVIMWLRKVDPQLINIVKMEYASELRTGKQLYELMPSVAMVIPILLAKHNSTVVRCGHNDTQDHYYDDNEVMEILVRKWNSVTWKQHTWR